MRVLFSRASSLVAPIALLLALVYSQIGWRRDRIVATQVSDRLETAQLQRTFPSDGEELAESSLRVIRGSDTVPIAQLVRGHRAVIYFDRPDCSSCIWFATKMDSILPSWRDSMTVISTHRREHPAPRLMLDSASTAQITGVPAMLVVDSDGVVRHSAPAGLPQVARLLEFANLPSPHALIGAYGDSLRSAPATASSATASSATGPTTETARDH